MSQNTLLWKKAELDTNCNMARILKTKIASAYRALLVLRIRDQNVTVIKEKSVRIDNEQKLPHYV